MQKSDSLAVQNTIAVFLTIMVIVVVWKLILPSYLANSHNLDNLDAEIIAANTKKDSLDQVKMDLSEIDSAYKAITVSIADDADEPNLIAELEAIALKNGLVLPSISISGDTSTSVAASSGQETTLDSTSAIPVGISLNTTGTFEQLNGLISSLEKSVKFMNIKSTNFSSTEDGMALSLQIEAYSRGASASSSGGTTNGVSSASGAAL